MIRLSNFLGIYPSTENMHFDFFNLNNGIFTEENVDGELNLRGENLEYLKRILKTSNLTHLRLFILRS